MSDFKIGIISDWLKLPFAEAMRTCRELGADGVQIYAVEGEMDPDNLTAADIVIHYDPWWNLAVQNQATDRAHRIGQKNVVNVYKLIAKDTIEENIVKLQEKKHALADQILSGEDMGSGSFSREEILELLGGK